MALSCLSQMICPLLWLLPQLQPELKCSSCLNKGELSEGVGEPPAEAVCAWGSSSGPGCLVFMVQAWMLTAFWWASLVWRKGWNPPCRGTADVPTEAQCQCSSPSVHWNTGTWGEWQSVPRNPDFAWDVLLRVEAFLHCYSHRIQLRSQILAFSLHYSSWQQIFHTQTKFHFSKSAH